MAKYQVEVTETFYYYICLGIFLATQGVDRFDNRRGGRPQS